MVQGANESHLYWHGANVDIHLTTEQAQELYENLRALLEPKPEQTAAEIAEDKGDAKYHEMVDEGRAVGPGGVR